MSVGMSGSVGVSVGMSVGLSVGVSAGLAEGVSVGVGVRISGSGNMDMNMGLAVGIISLSEGTRVRVANPASPAPEAARRKPAEATRAHQDLRRRKMMAKPSLANLSPRPHTSA